MKKYTLASPEARQTLDLTNYSTIITEAVHDVVPDAVVTVYKEYYTVDHISKGESIKVGRKICASVLGKYCITLNKLFSGKEVENDKT